MTVSPTARHAAKQIIPDPRPDSPPPPPRPAPPPPRRRGPPPLSCNVTANWTFYSASARASEVGY